MWPPPAVRFSGGAGPPAARGRQGDRSHGYTLTDMPRSRLDVALTERGLAESRERAQALILAGHVRVDGEVARKAGQPISDTAMLAVEQPPPYASRGGQKLAH